MPKMNDLTNKTFGYLTALYPTKDNKNRLVWHCKCICGKEIDINSCNLQSGKSKSCGCQKNKIISNKVKKKIIGEKYNHLTVLEETDKRQNGAIVWKCQCDCGNITYVPTGNLRSGHTKTCGKCQYQYEYLPRENLIGQKFENLLVIEKVNDEKYKKTQRQYWKCLCDCGNTCITYTEMLKSGKKTSCGCRKTSLGEEKIIKLLTENNIPFVQQKTFDDCRFEDSNKLARFDFWVNDTYIIEFDGQQHFLNINEEKGYYDNERILKIKEHDLFKTNYCQTHNIPLIRIPYTKYKNLTINDLLLKGDNI